MSSPKVNSPQEKNSNVHNTDKNQTLEIEVILSNTGVKVKRQVKYSINNDEDTAINWLDDMDDLERIAGWDDEQYKEILLESTRNCGYKFRSLHKEITDIKQELINWVIPKHKSQYYLIN